MKRLLSAAVIVMVLLLAGCRNGGGAAQQSSVLKVDSVYYAHGFTIKYYDDCKVVSIRDPWDTLKVRKNYVLVDKEKRSRRFEVPAEARNNAVIIPVPVERAVIYTSVHAAMTEQLGCIDRICGVCEPEYIISEEILARVADGRIADLGMSTAPNIEKIIDMDTEVIIASPFENSGYGNAEKIGVPIVEAADYMEGHPLGRTEWVRFYGLLFGCRDRADSLFFATCSKYDSLKALVSDIPVEERPTVIMERKYGALWGVPGASSYVALFHSDAGANYIFKDLPGTGSVQLSFEQVFEKAADADFWLLKYGTKKPMTYADLRGEYKPYSNFAAFKNHKIYTCNTLVTSYYDDITIHPDQILADLMYIYHPNLLEGHQPKYYFPMEQ
ncbi:MAG: ABC transporter substrate-binding protein [Bacteroidales bacterium]|nr:ABC transporter substrate-binding protein [Bacteroidales bacterium]MBR5670637.1 ABC transporter substrate-binding protein [Bacteroidales bacterium]